MALLSSVIQSGTRAAQPAATAVAAGVLYFVTDEGELERSTGAAWVQVAVNEVGHDTLDHTGLTGVGGGAASFSGAIVYAAAAQSVATATDVALVFDTEAFDTAAFHDNVTNNTRLSAVTGKTGKYLVSSSPDFATNGTGTRAVSIRVNGTTTWYLGSCPGSTSRSVAPSVSGIVDLPMVGDYVEIVVNQNSGGALNVAATTTRRTFFQYLG